LWIEHDGSVSVAQQCELLKLNRSSVYYKPEQNSNDDVAVMNEIKDIYEQYPFYGYRKIHNILCRKGLIHNIKKIRRLMHFAGIKAVAPYKKTSIRNQAHKIYPYLLNGLKIDRPNYVWKTDITYIKIKGGFVYLVCIIDVFSRKIMGWAVSIFLDTQVCIEALDMALLNYKPEILNSDQGCQFTSDAWVKHLEQNGIKISMDGKGRWADNIIIERFWRSCKYEAVFLSCFETVDELKKGLKSYIHFYNNERPHQALNYKTPNEVFSEAIDTVNKNISTINPLDLSIVFDYLMVKNYTENMGVNMGK
jgi:putative transposase